MPDQYRELSEEQSAKQEETASTDPVEQEILELERQLNEKKAEREKNLEQIMGQERPNQSSASPTAPAQRSQTPNPVQVKSDAVQLSGVEKNQQLQSLVNLAFAKGVAHATEVVRNLDNPYLMDEFHDTLIDEFHKKLVDEGKLEEI